MITDGMPEETLADVMWEIAEAKDRCDLISAMELKRRIGEVRRLGAFVGRRDDTVLAQRALVEVLGEIDEMLAGR